jgi:hypothetical protein
MEGIKITICPPCDSFPTEKPKKKVWNAPRNGHDKELCAGCDNKGMCEYLCAPLKWIDGDIPRRENFINQRMLQYEHPDYKTIIYDLSRHHNPPDRHEEIEAIKDMQIRAICAMLSFKIPKTQISTLLHISRTQLHRIIKSMLHPKQPTI